MLARGSARRETTRVGAGGFGCPAVTVLGSGEITGGSGGGGGAGGAGGGAGGCVGTAFTGAADGTGMGDAFRASGRGRLTLRRPNSSMTTIASNNAPPPNNASESCSDIDGIPNEFRIASPVGRGAAFVAEAVGMARGEAVMIGFGTGSLTPDGSGDGATLGTVRGFGCADA